MYEPMTRPARNADDSVSVASGRRVPGGIRLGACRGAVWGCFKDAGEKRWDVFLAAWLST